jgi:hypothetical protein
MEFWLPHSQSPDQAETVYATIKEWVRTQAFPPADDRIESVAYTHDGKHYIATVGQRDNLVGEEVIAIFRPMSEQQPWMVCTPNRGVARGAPVLVRPTNIVWFEPPR